MVSKVKGSEPQMRHNEGRKIIGHPTGSVERNDLHSSTLQEMETFGRRKRHKTRETRYESVKAPHTSRTLKWEKRRLEKSKSRRKVEKTGDDLIKNFSSRSVGQDRLTVRLETFH